MAVTSQPLRGRRACKKIFWAVFPHACFILSLVVYAFLGALMFSHIEGNRKVNLSEEYRHFLQNLWDISRNLSDNMTENEEVFKEEIHALFHTAKRDWFVNPKDIWTFFGSLFFCCTVFTTVEFIFQSGTQMKLKQLLWLGHSCIAKYTPRAHPQSYFYPFANVSQLLASYGNTYPVTRAGKYLCMLYALFGIPLMFLVLTDMGDILATVLSKSYSEFRKLQSKILASKFCPGSTCIRGGGSKVDVNEPLSIVEMLRSQSAVGKKPAQYRNAQIFEMLIARENEYKKLSRSKSIERWSSCPELDRGKTMTRVIENFDRIGKELEKLDVPIVLMVLVIFVYISCAAAILPNWETRLDFQEAFYFCFITLTTIGFGDTQLEHPKFFLFFSLYIIIGMEIVFIAFKLGQDRLIGLYKKVISFCGEKKVPAKKIYPK
ncbi:potassium channel subfamily K member 18 [Gallus gallus]|uniref:potassium channel subfamily K member 18 n=1 Tax=Gallus gallus TaxID=9031 RepID=UPI001AE3D5C2|nr:potassium channel subfamily K member 18 [Gallus gallus]